MSEAEQRERVVAEARSWFGVPWQHMGRSRGGVDCGGLLLVVFKALELMPQDFETGYYPPDFMMHTDEQRFVGFVERFCDKVERTPRDADIVLFKVGRVIAHCAIVDTWPRVIHAVRQGGKVEYDDADTGPLRAKFAGVWTLKGWA